MSAHQEQVRGFAKYNREFTSLRQELCVAGVTDYYAYVSSS
ncbi:hypothetical protein [Pseudidiomarina aestuarii]|nr:hypothetical protein [Pseudidiomarina aestuarii]